MRSALVTPLIATEGYGASELEACVDRAAILAERLDDRALLFPALYGQWVYRVAHAQHRVGIQIARKFFTLARAAGTRPTRLIGPPPKYWH